MPCSWHPDVVLPPEVVGAFIVPWNAAVLGTGARLEVRDNVFHAVYHGGLVVLVAFAVTRAAAARTAAHLSSRRSP